MTGFKFEHIDLETMFGSQEACPFVSDAITTALTSFRYEMSYSKQGDLHTFMYSVSDMHQRQRFAARDIQKVLGHVNKILRKTIRLAKQEADWWDGEIKDEWECGAILIDSMELAGPSLHFQVGENMIRERQMLAAVVLMQCERCIEAYVANDTLAVGHLMWDISQLLMELDHEDNLDEAALVATGKALELNRRRHARRDADKNRVVNEWESNPSRFASAAEAGRHYVEVLSQEGRDYEPNTVRDWIRAHAKEKGIRLR